MGISARETTRGILIIPPLFDEMNRMRRVLVSAMRILAGRGVSTVLPDLPGCNESEMPLEQQDLNSWRDAMSAAAQNFGATHIASLRGGCLIDDGPSALPHWRLAPVNGGSLLKNLLRTRIAGDKEAGIENNMESLLESGRKAAIELAGNRIGPAMIASLEMAEPAHIDNITHCELGGAEGQIKGSALWLRAEPQDDPEMAASLADRLDKWSASCGG